MKSRTLIFVGSVILVTPIAACSSANDDATSSTKDAICTVNPDPGEAFRAYVAQTGGKQGAGLPISGVFDATSADGRSYKTQCFERRVLEYHPENGCEHRVEGRLLGRERLDRLGGQPDAAAAEGASLGAPTGKLVRDDFTSHWAATGGLAENGWPISDYFWEDSESEPGKQYLVQYFERAVFEYHPENAAPYDVLGKLLGSMSPTCQSHAATKPSVNIRLAAFIPGPKPGTTDPKCERVNFGNFIGGSFGGIYNTDARDFSYERAMHESKYAVNLDLADDGVVAGSFQKYATTSCRYDDDGGEVFPGTDGWCRRASSSPPVICKKADDAGVGYSDVQSLGTNPDGRKGVRIKVKLLGNIPVQIVSFPIDASCQIDMFFDGATHEPVDFWVGCNHKAFPSLELYVAGVQVKTHSAFGHLPLDLAVPGMIETKHHCTKVNDTWSCRNE